VLTSAICCKTFVDIIAAEPVSSFTVARIATAREAPEGVQAILNASAIDGAPRIALIDVDAQTSAG